MAAAAPAGSRLGARALDKIHCAGPCWKFMAAPDVPTKYELFRDELGTWWRVDSVISSDRLDGFYIVRVAFGPTSACESDRLVLGRGEFMALKRDRRLVVQPTVRGGGEDETPDGCD
jgi:hypothetical protein